MELCFVSAVGGSAFMHELLCVVAAEARAVGAQVSIHEGDFPDLVGEQVYVVVPHEYFVVTPTHRHPSPAQLQRTIGFAVEHPGNETFEVSARWSQHLAGVLDINDDSREELARRGISAERFQLGYSERWDTWRGAAGPRPIDVTYLGTAEQRRSRALASYAEVLASYETAFLMPPHEPMVRPRPDFLMGEAKFRHLASSKLLLNLHRGRSRSLEWVRILEAICNGCVVVSEHSVDFAPFVPGNHAVFGHARSLGDLAALLLRNPDEIDRIRDEAYSFVRSELCMAESANRMVAMAETVCSSPDRTTIRAPHTVATRVSLARPVDVSDPSRWSSASAALPTAELRISTQFVRELHRSVYGVAPSAEASVQTDEARAAGSVDCLVAASGQYQRSAPVLTEGVGRADREALSPRMVCWSGHQERGTTAGQEPAVVVGNGPASRGSALNRLLERSDAEFVLVLDPEVRLLPGALSRLVNAIDSSAADCVFPMVREWDGDISNALPFEPERLRHTAYLGSTALWRRSAVRALGGWSEDEDLGGLEDHHLWCRLARSNGNAHLVPQVLATRAHPSFPGVTPPVDVSFVWDRAAPRQARRSDSSRT